MVQEQIGMEKYEELHHKVICGALIERIITIFAKLNI